MMTTRSAAEQIAAAIGGIEMALQKGSSEGGLPFSLQDCRLPGAPCDITVVPLDGSGPFHMNLRLEGDTPLVALVEKGLETSGANASAAPGAVRKPSL